MRLLRSSLREPALHFVLVGAALFALHATVAGDLEEEPARIVVDRAVRAELADAIAHRRARPATEAEIEAAVDGWIDEEVLYREALARGLDRGDPRVRALVAYTMRSVLEAQTRVPEPSEAELRAYFEADAGRWARKPRIDLTHVFVEGDDDDARARAGELAEQLRRGASPAGLGDTFSGGRRYRGRRPEDLAEQFGADFVAGVQEQPIGAWAVHRSRFGMHVVRVDARRAGSTADLASVRAAVRDAWMEERERAAVEAAIEELRARWEIVREP